MIKLHFFLLFAKNASSENSDTAAKQPETNDAAAEPEQTKAPVDTKSVSSPLLRMFDNIRARNVSFYLFFVVDRS